MYSLLCDDITFIDFGGVSNVSSRCLFLTYMKYPKQLVQLRKHINATRKTIIIINKYTTMDSVMILILKSKLEAFMNQYDVIVRNVIMYLYGLMNRLSFFL